MAIQMPATPSLETGIAAVRLCDVTKQYAGNTYALNHVDLTIQQGEVVSILGPSGCGKTTLLRIMAGLSTATSGEVNVLGLNPEDRTDGRQGDIASVFREPTLMPWRSVLDNVSLPLELMGVPRRERHRRAMALLSMLGLEDVTKQMPRQLSDGMRMRVSLARALVSNPRLLLLDAPFAALDDMTRQQLHKETVELWRRFGMTIVFATQNPYEAIHLSSRVVVMQSSSGKIKESDP